MVKLRSHGSRSREPEVLGVAEAAETIPAGRAIRELERLQRVYGRGRWQKPNGMPTVRLGAGDPFRAEIHWYEAHGIARKEYKIKQILEATSSPGQPSDFWERSVDCLPRDQEWQRGSRAPRSAGFES